jgi:hypothetical protein
VHSPKCQRTVATVSAQCTLLATLQRGYLYTGILRNRGVAYLRLDDIAVRHRSLDC